MSTDAVQPDAVQPGADSGDSAAAGGPTEVGGWRGELAGVFGYLARRLTGERRLDDLGYDADFTEHVWLPALRVLFDNWFRIEVLGVENIPDGGVLLVANHSGTIPVDALMTTVAVHDRHPAHRMPRMLGADLLFDTPLLAPLARRIGATPASPADAEQLLGAGECVGVFPEGFKGVGKMFAQRYRLQRFGRGGFVSAAINNRVPIVPCSIVGAEEIYPMIGDIPALARALGLPYFPVTPTFPWLGPLGAIPLPSKWIIEFGVPLPTGELPVGAAQDAAVVAAVADRVRDTIADTLARLLVRRGHPFFD